jgi:CTP:phosphocholine cytidylyltransferase-like protein
MLVGDRTMIKELVTDFMIVFGIILYSLDYFQHHSNVTLTYNYKTQFYHQFNLLKMQTCQISIAFA